MELSTVPLYPKACILKNGVCVKLLYGTEIRRNLNKKLISAFDLKRIKNRQSIVPN